MFRLFNVLLAPFYPALFFYLWWRRYVKKRSAASVRGLRGIVPPEVSESLKDGKPVIWLHAVSVGETIAARPVAKALKAAMPECRIGLSCITDTGYETALAAKKAGEVDAAFFYPLDLPIFVRRALKSVRPDVFLTMETELWPNFLHIARQSGTKTVLVNGRISDRMLANVPKLKPFWRWVFSNLDGVLLRSSTDAARFDNLAEQLKIAPPQLVTGDVKLDAASPVDVDEIQRAREKWRTVFGIEKEAPLIVAGSTHPGEEAMVLDTFHRLKEVFFDVRLIIAPRHIERAEEVTQIIQAHKFPVLRRSQNEKATNAVGLLDTVGELSEVYAAADVAFVGGSLIKRGGHNMLEPVLRGVPVVFGPYVMNFRDAAKLVEESQTGTQVSDETVLVDALRDWLHDEKLRRDLPQRAAQALEPHRGATRRVAEWVRGLVQ
jgi:3-deoxy-D-manno-octulosonic-acid transferase